MYGITTWHIRILCENPWEGGAGYTPEQVGNMTLDEVLMRLADKKVLKAKMNRSSRKGDSVTLKEVSSLASSDGTIKGRSKDGTPIKGRIRGKSVARELMEKQKALAEANKKDKRRNK